MLFSSGSRFTIFSCSRVLHRIDSNLIILYSRTYFLCPNEAFFFFFNFRNLWAFFIWAIQKIILNKEFLLTYDNSINGIDPHSQICFFQYLNIVQHDLYIAHCDTEIHFQYILEFLKKSDILKVVNIFYLYLFQTNAKVKKFSLILPYKYPPEYKILHSYWCWKILLSLSWLTWIYIKMHLDILKSIELINWKITTISFIRIVWTVFMEVTPLMLGQALSSIQTSTPARRASRIICNKFNFF